MLVGRQEGHPACKQTEWWGTGVVICLEQGADLHMAQLMPLPFTVSCFSKIQIGFTLLVPADQGSLGQRDVKRLNRQYRYKLKSLSRTIKQSHQGIETMARSRCQVTVLGKLFTPIMSLFSKQ